VGVIFLGDTTRRGLTPVAAVGFALAVACAVMLARFGEADHGPGGAPGFPDTPPETGMDQPGMTAVSCQPEGPRAAPGGAAR
jgi:hypothetical protein